MRRIWILLLCWSWCLAGPGAAPAQDEWRPVAKAEAGTPATPARLSRPRIRLGAPQGTKTASAPDVQVTPASTEFTLDQLRVFQQEPMVHQSSYRGQPPQSGPYRSTSFGQGPVMAPEEQYNCGVVSEGPPGGHPWLSPFRNCWDRMFGSSPNCSPGGSSGGLFSMSFQSDHAFDEFISPMTNPFFFEDPRSLTEIRLLFSYDKGLGDNPLVRGGNIFQYTIQGRLALNENLSIVLHRLGFTTINPGGTATPGAPLPMGFEGGTALSDLQLGPKWTFYRNQQSQTIAALGANFEIPIGSDKVLAGNGAAVTPYLSVGQGLGNFHFLGAAGYRFGLSGDRADNAFASLHADYRIGTPLGTFYPLVELNYYYYTKNGSNLIATYEGADAFNLGATDIKGKSIFTLGAGLRYKFSETIQAGAVYEFPLTGKENGLNKYRIGVDLIFRF